MPLTAVNRRHRKVEVVEETKLRGLIQITRTGDAWECKAVVYNSNLGASSVVLNDEKVVDLFKAVGCLYPVEQAESHVVEFFDGPDASVWASFGFDASKFVVASKN